MHPLSQLMGKVLIVRIFPSHLLQAQNRAVIFCSSLDLTPSLWQWRVVVLSCLLSWILVNGQSGLKLLKEPFWWVFEFYGSARIIANTDSCFSLIVCQCQGGVGDVGRVSSKPTLPSWKYDRIWFSILFIKVWCEWCTRGMDKETISVSNSVISDKS